MFARAGLNFNHTHTMISTLKDTISIKCKWGKEEWKKLEISKEGFLKIYERLENNGELVKVE